MNKVLSKAEQMELAWAQHDKMTCHQSPEDQAEANHLDAQERRHHKRKDNRRRNAEGQVVIFANRDEINECAMRTWLIPRAERRKAREKEAKIAEAAAKAKKEAEVKAEREAKGKAKAAEKLSTHKYSNLGELQMLTQGKVAA